MRDVETQRETETETETERERQRQRDRERERDRQTDRDRVKGIERERNRGRIAVITTQAKGRAAEIMDMQGEEEGDLPFRNQTSIKKKKKINFLTLKGLSLNKRRRFTSFLTCCGTGFNVGERI